MSLSGQDQKRDHESANGCKKLEVRKRKLLELDKAGTACTVIPDDPGDDQHDDEGDGALLAKRRSDTIGDALHSRRLTVMLDLQLYKSLDCFLDMTAYGPVVDLTC